jgi:hypothetical protein
MPRWTLGIPDPARARRWQVARRDSEVGRMAFFVTVVPPVVVLMVVFDDDRDIGPAMHREGRAAGQPKGSDEDQADR